MCLVFPAFFYVFLFELFTYFPTQPKVPEIEGEVLNQFGVGGQVCWIYLEDGILGLIFVPFP